MSKEQKLKSSVIFLWGEKEGMTGERFNGQKYFFPKLDFSHCLRLNVKVYFGRTSSSHMLRLIIWNTDINSNLQF